MSPRLKDGLCALFILLCFGAFFLGILVTGNPGVLALLWS